MKRDGELAQIIMRSYARKQGSQATAGTILADIITNEGDDVSENTIYSYLKALRKIFVIEDSAAWNPNLRSKSAIRTSDTRYFADPSIATAALGLGPEDLINDLNTFETVKDSDGDDCSLEDYCEFDADGGNWIEKKLKLNPDSRYYIQFFTPRNGEAFAKKVSFKIKTEGDFNIDKLSLVYDSTFDKLFWKIYNEEEEGRVVGYIMDDFDMGLYTPYEICYDGKTVKANKFSLGRALCGTAYMTFKWE